MEHTSIIIRPLVTEKSTHQQSTRNAYAFEVRKDSDKTQIKEAVEKLYNVKVLDVRTMVRKGKPRRTKVREITTSSWKRAIVVLAENSKIDLF